MSSQLPSKLVECNLIIKKINMIVLTNITSFFLIENLGSISQNLVFFNIKVMPSYKTCFIYLWLNYETI
jgi:hypothetical protein